MKTVNYNQKRWPISWVVNSMTKNKEKTILKSLRFTIKVAKDWSLLKISRILVISWVRMLIKRALNFWLLRSILIHMVLLTMNNMSRLCRRMQKIWSVQDWFTQKWCLIRLSLKLMRFKITTKMKFKLFLINPTQEVLNLENKFSQRPKKNLNKEFLS